MSEENKDHLFKEGNTIGKETRFKHGNSAACKYKDCYADSLLSFFNSCENFPTFERWAVNNNISMRTMKQWISEPDKYPRFALAHEKCKAIQKDLLFNNGLLRKYDSSLVKFLLVNNHDMVEKTEQKIEGETSADITINIREVN